MLFLSRKEGKSITFNLLNKEQKGICLNRYVGQATKLEIDAPDDVQILRAKLIGD